MIKIGIIQESNNLRPDGPPILPAQSAENAPGKNIVHGKKPAITIGM